MLRKQLASSLWEGCIFLEMFTGSADVHVWHQVLVFALAHL